MKNGKFPGTLAKGNQSWLRDENCLVSEQTSKGNVETLVWEGPSGQGYRQVALGRLASLGCHPWLSDQVMSNSMGLEKGLRKNGIINVNLLMGHWIHQSIMYHLFYRE